MNKLADYADKPEAQAAFDKVKQLNKQRLAEYIQRRYNIKVDEKSIFDVQIKRIHSYKRQLLNILHIMTLYNKLRKNPDLDMVPRTFIFGGKAAPGYHIAKQTIKLINVVADKINADTSIRGKLKVVFVENYSVSLGEILFPAADVSEQISTASKEASGTGNMKFMLNGALTIGTLDGANVEIHESVGNENIFIFGMSAQEVIDLYNSNSYRSWDIYNANLEIKEAVEQMVNGFYGRSEDFRTLYDYFLVNNDEFFVFKDFEAYAQAQREVDKAYRDRAGWLRSCIINIAKAGRFASDRTIREYADEIWRVKHI